MRLASFNVRDYRSVKNSGEVIASQRTALVGRNESGKTNLLLALGALNPPVSGPVALNKVKDAPRTKRLSDFADGTRFLDTTWQLTPTEQDEVCEECPSLRGVSSVTIGMDYAGKRYIGFVGSKAIAVDTKLVDGHLTAVQRSIRASAAQLDPATATVVNNAVLALKKTCDTHVLSPHNWAGKVAPAVQQLRKAAADASLTLADKASEGLDELQDYAENILEEQDRLKAARSVVLRASPVFVFLDEYPEIHGRQHLGELVGRIDSGEMLPADQNFMKLMKVAGLDPSHLRQILDAEQGAEERQLLTDRASALVTEKIRELWKDRELTVHFALDADYFNILISDPTSVYPVKVNLDERSRGFRWFFSFFVTFAADTQGGPAENAIILLDEPGLYLHATAQADLLKLFKNDFTNQILYTTHSPFMIPVDEMDSVRTVNISQGEGTTVSNDPKGDSRTLFPLQSALGYTISQTLFVGATNVVVEGVTDFWYLAAASELLGKNGLAEAITITPGGGAQKVSYMVALLTAERTNVVVLFDSERNSRSTAEELARDRLLNEKDVVFVGDAFEPVRSEADIEDLLDPEVYQVLVEESYANELAGRRLALNENVPRIVKRYEQAFVQAGLEFNKTRPARLFLSKLSKEPEVVMPASVLNRFAVLFAKLNARLSNKAAAGTGPFGYPGTSPVVVTDAGKSIDRSTQPVKE